MTRDNSAPVAALPEPAAHVWYHRGMANFDDEAPLAALDDGKGTSIPLFTASQMHEHAAKVTADLDAELHEQCRLLGIGGEREVKLAAENIRLKTLVDALQANDRRYRFLRDSDAAMWRPYGLRTNMHSWQADAVVDAAIAAEKRTGEQT